MRGGVASGLVLILVGAAVLVRGARGQLSTLVLGDSPAIGSGSSSPASTVPAAAVTPAASKPASKPSGGAGGAGTGPQHPTSTVRK